MDDTAIAPERIMVEVKQLADTHRFSDFESVVRSGPEQVERMKADLRAYAAEHNVVVLPVTVKVEWVANLTVQGVSVPPQIFEGCETPAEARRALEQFRAGVESIDPTYREAVMVDVRKPKEK